MTTMKSFERAIKHFNLDFEVEKVPLYTVLGEDVQELEDSYQALVRTDTKQTLGIVSSRYPIISPREKFHTLERISKTGNLGLVNGGTFGTNKGSIFLQTKLTNNLPRLEKLGEIVEARINFISSYNKKVANIITYTAYRLACHNGLLVPDITFKKKIRNIGELFEKLEDIEMTLEGFVKDFNQIDKILERFYKTKIYGDEPVRKFVDLVIKPSAIVNEDSVLTQLHRRRSEALEAIYHAEGQESLDMTLYKLYNGISYLANHNSKIDDEFQYINFGTGAKLMSDAYEVCKKYLVDKSVLS